MSKRTDWFVNDRFGMFIHWGLYAIPGRGEWVRSFENISKEDYQIYFDDFDPVDVDPRKWVQTAKDAGMKYVVLTAKHHDGFCLFDSKLTDYKITNTKCGRDIIKEYTDACRELGMKCGIYYSLIDWYHPDYPHYGDAHHPMRDNEAFKDYEYNFDNYVEYLHGQVREICSNYGKIDVLWFDFSYKNMQAEKWKATELVRMVRSLQPDVIIDNRLEDNHAPDSARGSLLRGEPTEYAGDFASPEQVLPHTGVFDDKGNELVWELCTTLNNNWGYAESDHEYKTADIVIRKLVECVSKGGNMLINVGPDAKGNIPAWSEEILAQVGQWMKKNGESIYGCGRFDLPRFDLGRYTQKDARTIYAHILEQSIGYYYLPGIDPAKVESIRVLYSGADAVSNTHEVNDPDYTGELYVNFVRPKYKSCKLPDPIDSVLKITLKKD